MLINTPLVIGRVALKLGPFEIHWYAIFIVLGTAIGVWLAMREAPRKKIDPDWVIDFILMAFPAAVVGARAYYVAFQWSYYSQNPSQIIAMWDGGGAIYGSLIAGFIVLMLYCRHQHVNPLDFLDICIPGVFLAQAMGRWGNFVNQEAYGKIVSNLNYLPSFIRQQMFIDGFYREPTFLFESMGTLSGFLIVMILRHHLKFLKSGDVFAFYLVWYGIVRAIVEGMRTDSLMWGPFRVSQVLSCLLAIVGIIFFFYNHSNHRKIKITM